MFEPTVQKLSAVHSISKTQVGDAVREILDGAIEGARDILGRVDPYDVKEVSAQQTVIRVCQGFRSFLDKDLETLLMEYGLEEDDKDE